MSNSSNSEKSGLVLLSCVRKLYDVENVLYLNKELSLLIMQRHL